MRRKEAKGAPKDSEGQCHALLQGDDHDNRNNSIKKVRNSFLRDRERGVQGSNTHWEHHGTVVVVVDMAETENVRRTNIADHSHALLWERRVEKGGKMKERGGEGESWRHSSVTMKRAFNLSIPQLAWSTGMRRDKQAERGEAN